MIQRSRFCRRDGRLDCFRHAKEHQAKKQFQKEQKQEAEAQAAEASYLLLHIQTGPDTLTALLNLNTVSLCRAFQTMS